MVVVDALLMTLQSLAAPNVCKLGIPPHTDIPCSCSKPGGKDSRRHDSIKFKTWTETKRAV